jgi:hypothetical protein
VWRKLVIAGVRGISGVIPKTSHPGKIKTSHPVKIVRQKLKAVISSISQYFVN